MSFLDQFTDAKAEYRTDSTTDMMELFGPSDGSVTLGNAQKISLVFSCVEIKANAIAVIPIKTYKRKSSGKSEDYDNPLYELLRYAPNPELTASLYKKAISQDLDLRGDHYSQIVRNGLGEVSALYPLISDKMELRFDANGTKNFWYDGKHVPSRHILHIFDIPDETGKRGISRIEYAKQELEFTKSASEFGNRLFKNSAVPSGVFEHPSELSKDAFDRLKSGLDKKYTGLMNTGRPMLLEDGVTYKPLTLKSSDSEWLASRKFNREQVCSMFNVPTSMVNDPSNTSYGNLEQKYQEFTTGPIYVRTTIIEEQFRLDLIPVGEKRTTVIKFKYNAMLRVDTDTKTKYYKMRHETASITPNQIRAYEDENGYEGGDEHYIMTNMTTVKKLSEGGDANE